MSALTTIDFHGAKLIAIAGDRPETTLVAMKPIVEGMGLAWEKQRERINEHPVLGSAPTIRGAQMPGDDQERQHLFMPLARINFWLATVNPKQIKNEAVRARVIEYQTEAADVLFNHFFGRAIAAGDHLTAGQTGGIVKAVVTKMRGELMADIRAEIKAELVPVLENLRVTHQTGTSAVTDKTAKEWLEEYGCVAKGRQALVRQLGNALRRIAMREGIALLECARTGTDLFPTSLARPYMEGPGKAMIRLHNAAVKDGQSALRLPGMPSTLHRIAARRAARRMTDSEMARALGICTNALPTVRAEHPTPLPELRSQLRGAARALMQLWDDLDHEETFARFAASRAKELEGAH